jgi:hypothetical protein
MARTPAWYKQKGKRTKDAIIKGAQNMRYAEGARKPSPELDTKAMVEEFKKAGGTVRRFNEKGKLIP